MIKIEFTEESKKNINKAEKALRKMLKNVEDLKEVGINIDVKVSGGPKIELKR